MQDKNGVNNGEKPAEENAADNITEHPKDEALADDTESVDTAANEEISSAVAVKAEDDNTGSGEGEPEIEVSDADSEEFVPYVPKLNEKQQRIWQTVLGIVCGFAVMFSLFLGSFDPENTLFRWLFLIVFVAIMAVRNQVEKRTGVSLRTFMKFFLIGLAVSLGVYVLYIFVIPGGPGTTA